MCPSARCGAGCRPSGRCWRRMSARTAGGSARRGSTTKSSCSGTAARKNTICTGRSTSTIRSSTSSTGTTGSATAFFRRTSATISVIPTTVVSDHYQSYLQPAQRAFPEATSGRTGLHRARGETTTYVERSHIAIRDRLRSSRGVKTRVTGRRCSEGFGAVQALGHGRVPLE